ncbi:WXG100-like domain-containing protein [Nocardia spumae]
MEIPEYLEPVASIVACKWPECDETALLRMADHWEHMGDTLSRIRAEGDAVTTAILARIDGRTNESIQRFWGTAGEDLDGLVTFCKAIAIACRVMAVLILAVKLYIIAMLVELAINLAIAAATAVETLGASLAEAAGAEVVTRAMIQQALKQLLERIIEETLIEAFEGFMKGVGKELAWEAGETALGLRDGISLTDVGKAGLHNAVSSAATGALHGALGKVGVDEHSKRPDAHHPHTHDSDTPGGPKTKAREKFEGKVDEFGEKVADEVVEGPEDDKKRFKSDATELAKKVFGGTDEESSAPTGQLQYTAPNTLPDNLEFDAPQLVVTARPAGSGFGLDLDGDTFHRDGDGGRLRIDD